MKLKKRKMWKDYKFKMRRWRHQHTIKVFFYVSSLKPNSIWIHNVTKYVNVAKKFRWRNVGQLIPTTIPFKIQNWLSDPQILFTVRCTLFALNITLLKRNYSKWIRFRIFLHWTNHILLKNTFTLSMFVICKPYRRSYLLHDIYIY